MFTLYIWKHLTPEMSTGLASSKSSWPSKWCLTGEAAGYGLWSGGTGPPVLRDSPAPVRPFHPAQLGRRDLNAASVDHNLAYYDTLRRLAPEARSRAIRSLGAGPPQSSDG